MSAVEGTARAGGLLMCDVRNVFFLVQLPGIKKLNFTMPARKEQWQTKLLSQILLEVNFARGMKNFPPAKF